MGGLMNEQIILSISRKCKFCNEYDYGKGGYPTIMYNETEEKYEAFCPACGCELNCTIFEGKIWI